jgi:hypothetical protein
MLTTQEAQAINALIVADPALSSQPQTSDGAYAIAAALNTPSEAGYKPITVGAAMLWAAGGPRVRIQAAATDSQQPEAVQASCQVFLDLIVSGSEALIHTEEQAILQAFSGWVVTGVITQAEYDAIYGASGLAAALLSRSVVAIGRDVSYQDVMQARAS